MEKSGREHVGERLLTEKPGQEETEESTLSVSDGTDDTVAETQRETWSHHIEFVLSLVGYAVGLGNFWRFPYLCMRNGGGAFLVPYFVFLCLCAVPVYFLELAAGQFSAQSPLSLWKFIPFAGGLGWAMVLVSGVVCIYYNVILAWALYFMFASFTTGTLPWATCDNSWNTPGCVQRGGQQLRHDLCDNITHNATYCNVSDVMSSNVTSNLTRMTAAEEYWQYGVLQLTEGIHDLGGVRWPMFGCLAIAWLFVFGSLFKGVRSLGKVVYVTATLPYVMLFVLLIRGVTLPGSAAGIWYYLSPDFSRLGSFQVWLEACAQIFYSLGPGYGGLITMASYNKFHNNCLRDSLLVPAINCLTSVFAGFVVFSTLGYMAHMVGVPVDKVVTSGPGLAFIVYPEALATLPMPQIWSAIFFMLLVIIGLDTQFGMFETTSSGFVDQFPGLLRTRKTRFTGALCVVSLLLGLPLVTKGGMYVFQIFDWYSASFSLMTISVLQCLFLAWAYGSDRFCADISLMLGHNVGMIVWKVCWMFISPAIFLVVIFCTMAKFARPTYGPYLYPWWAEAIGWGLGTCSLVPLPICAGLAVWRQSGTLRERLRKALSPSNSWGSQHDSKNCKICLVREDNEKSRAAIV